MAVALDASPGVEIDGLTFAHDRTRHQLLDVSLAIESGQVCCLLGPNGTGKTTLLRCVLGLLKAQRGTVRIAGEDVGALSARRLARTVAYVPQTMTTAFPFTALDIAVMGRTPHVAMIATPSEADRRHAADVLDRLGIGHLAGRAFSSLSGGERQLALFARALVQEAPVLILDEPTAALDYGNAMRILHLVRDLARGGRTIVMSTHQPDHAFACGDRAALLQGGRVTAHGPPVQVLTDEHLTELYGVAIHVVQTEVRDADGRQMHACLAVDDDRRTDEPAPAHTSAPRDR